MEQVLFVSGKTPEKKKRSLLRDAVVTAFATFLVVFAYRFFAKAGSLTPSVTPTSSTMQDLNTIYNPLVGTFDSSTTTASSSGNILQVTKCIGTRMTGGNCP